MEEEEEERGGVWPTDSASGSTSELTCTDKRSD